MATVRRCRVNKPVVIAAPSDDVMENLQFIRRTMEVSGAFTAVPGWGLVAVGVTAIGAALIANEQLYVHRWLLTWIGEAIIGLAIALWSMYIKATRTGVTLLAAPGRKFALGLLPPLLCGAILTPILYRADAIAPLPAVWLLLYGTAVVTGGAFSIRIVPVMGMCFMALGVVAFLTPAAWSLVWMLAGFAGLHMVFGFMIARNYGG
jgi:hypothetical protein